MKVYISTDMEGISGICLFEQVRIGSPHYEASRRLLMGDVNAAVEGCLLGGATRVVVMDGHGGGFNFIPEEMHPEAEFVTGTERPFSHPGADEGFQAGMFVGYHSQAGTAKGMLHHTQSSESGNLYWYNGRPSGEIAQCATILGHFKIPVVMVTGDDAACREAREFLGDGIVTVSVKRGYSRQCGCLIPPQKAHEMIRAGAQEAMKRARLCQPYTPATPIVGRLRFPDKTVADRFRPVRSRRVDDYTFEATFESPLDIYGF